jgi:hypothetical protein
MLCGSLTASPRHVCLILIGGQLLPSIAFFSYCMQCTECWTLNSGCKVFIPWTYLLSNEAKRGGKMPDCDQQPIQ